MVFWSHRTPCKSPRASIRVMNCAMCVASSHLFCVRIQGRYLQDSFPKTLSSQVHCVSRNRWPSIWLILQKSFSRHFDVPMTCEALELLFGTSFQQLESLVTHTQKLGAQLAPPAFKGLRLACCVAHVPNLRLMVFSLMMVIRITEQSGVACGESGDGDPVVKPEWRWS